MMPQRWPKIHLAQCILDLEEGVCPGDAMKPVVRTRPTGFAAIRIFFFLGAAMACYAAITLLLPGTFLDHGWDLNPTARARLLPPGRIMGLPFIVAAALGLTGVGWFRRRFWGWLVGCSMIAINLASDAINLLAGERLKGAVGVLFAGLLLSYMASAKVRSYFSKP